jgi:hypothetical protein
MRRYLALILGIAACSPLTPYRASVAVPAAAPPHRVGAPIGAGEAAVGAWASRQLLGPADLVPMAGDPGLWIPAWSAGANVRYGVGTSVEIGGGVEISPRGGWQRSATGVFAIPGDAPMLAASAQVTAGHMWGPFGFGGTVDFGWMSLPHATWRLNDLEDAGGLADGDGAGAYRLTKQSHLNTFRVRLGSAFTWRLREVLELDAGWFLTPLLTNEGFSYSEPAPIQLGGLAIGPVLRVEFRPVPQLGLGLQTHFGFGAATVTGVDTGFGTQAFANVRFGPSTRRAAPP